MATKKKPVLVTTEYRGVFYGYLKSHEDRTVVLEKCHNVIYWHRSVGGVFGLCKTGPNNECRIGAEAPEITLYGVTSVANVSPDAEKAWSAL